MKLHRIRELLGQADGVLLRFLGASVQDAGAMMHTEAILNQPMIPWVWSQAGGARDTVLIIDVSGSMGTTDYPPNRLEASKKAAEEYVRQRADISPADRIAVVAFSDKANVILPLTSIDQMKAIVSSIKKLKIGGGTDINQGLKQAPRILFKNVTGNQQQVREKHILLQTDGHGGHPIRLSGKLKNKGVLIEVIGIGGDRSAVDETLLCKVATTDADGVTHYWFIDNKDSLVARYRELATGIVMRNGQ